MPIRLSHRGIGLAVIATLLPVGLLEAQSVAIREVTASATTIVQVNTRLRVSTTIELPENDSIEDVVCGDPLFWVIDRKANVVHVRPAKEGAATDLKLLTKLGMHYVFWLSQKKDGAVPDVWLRVAPDTSVVEQNPPEVDQTGEHIEQLQAELAEAQTMLDAANRRSVEAVDSFRQKYPTELQFAYGTPKYKKPFFVRAIWHDGKFTYLRSDAPELPAIYEIVDGKPAVVNFQVQGKGTYVVSKVLERGYLAIGDARLSFAQQGR